ncbi:MAG: nuclear transport factor 2 family protein [Caldimonas sp.]
MPRGDEVARAGAAGRVERWRPALLLASLAGALLLPAAHAQGVAPPGMRAGGMATRSVSRYLGLERSLQEALAGRDRAGVTALLADDFVLRTSAGPDVESADDWLRRELASAQREGLVRDLSVREADDVAIVSFLLDRGPAGRPATATWFVVDVWRQSTQRLLARSMTRAAAAPRRPGRPTGRE